MFTDEEIQNWNNAGNPTEIHVGEYRGVLAGGKFITTKSGARKLCLEYSILEPKNYQGQKYAHFLNMDTKNQMFYTKQALVSLGVNVNVPITGVEIAIGEKVGTPLSFAIVQNDNYKNCTILSSEPLEDDINF